MASRPSPNPSGSGSIAISSSPLPLPLPLSLSPGHTLIDLMISSSSPFLALSLSRTCVLLDLGETRTSEEGGFWVQRDSEKMYI